MQRVERTVGGCLPFSLLDEVYEGSPISSSGPSQRACCSVVSASWATLPEFSISLSFFLVDSLFVMNINIGWRLPDAHECGRKEEGGHD